MDKNKLIKLREIDYTIRETCSICTHSSFKARESFGVCERHLYAHKKHTGPARKLSIFNTGHCDGFERRPSATRFGLWEEFFNRR